jgi:hypothetical protein
MWGFAEWGLPVIYGFILLVEHIWMFGSYIVVYLMGVKTRKSAIANVIEDLIAMTIMVGRVGLQTIRGLIVGMFHFICREAVLNMTRWWFYDSVANHGLGTACSNTSFSGDLLVLWCDFWLAVGSLVVVTAIMFLQLTFLFVCV